LVAIVVVVEIIVLVEAVIVDAALEPVAEVLDDFAPAERPPSEGPWAHHHLPG
jgi:hypothetical protein